METVQCIYTKAKEFRKKYPWAIAWRIKKHCKVIQQHLNPNEEVKYVFVAQKGDNQLDFWNTCVCVLTNKRLLFANKRILLGYYFLSITPDLFNDMKIKRRLIWGIVVIDTLKEIVLLSNVPNKALIEIETRISEYMIREKRKYGRPTKVQ